MTEYAAGRMITLADAFVHRYPAVLESLAGGRITLKHAEILVDAVDELMPDLRDDGRGDGPGTGRGGAGRHVPARACTP